MKKYIYILIMTAVIFTGCNSDDDFLNRKPTDIFLDEQTWQNKNLIFSVLADLYSRYNDFQENEKWYEYCTFDEAFASTAIDWQRHKNMDYGYNSWATWDYGYIRHLNLFLEKCEKATVLEPADKTRFLAEARFLRAAYYFEMVKRMGGVPLIKEALYYDNSGNPAYLQHPRNKESEVYDFVISEMEDIKTKLPNDASVKSRATMGVALAVKSRAALYAGSIARYGVSTPSVTLPKGEIGIDASKATGYYETALGAAQELILTKKYTLYKKNPVLSENFASLFTDKTNNQEAIFVKDYQVPSKTHNFTVYAIPLSMRENSTYGGALNPALNIVQLFEKLDNTIAPYNIGTYTNPVLYDSPLDLFAGRDARLEGTVILPGSSFRNKQVDIWAGYITPEGKVISGGKPGATAILPGESSPSQVVGNDGPVDNVEYCTQSGFYIRKYNDTKQGSGLPLTGSEVWFIRYRYGEVLLNAAEAAFELSNTKLAASYLNEVRQRAGFTKDLTQSEITFDRIVHERRVELAYEGHNLWDMKRWRLAHKVWDGVTMTAPTSTPAVSTERNTMVFGLWPYKLYAPGTPMAGKWVFSVVKPSNVTAAHRFRQGNYYSEINTTILSNNPQITKQPNQ